MIGQSTKSIPMHGKIPLIAGLLILATSTLGGFLIVAGYREWIPGWIIGFAAGVIVALGMLRDWQQSRSRDKDTTEVEIKGRKVQMKKQTVPTGAGSVTRFVRNLLS